jgi:penicillin-binding protein 2
VYFYLAAQAMGIDRIDEVLGALGFGKRTDIDIPHEKSGVLPSREWKRRVFRQVWFPGETINVGIGQGYLTVTPLQLAQGTARIAMRGAGFQPHLVHATEDPHTRSTAAVAPQPLPAIDARNRDAFERVIQAMQLVTMSPGGTAYSVFKDAPYTSAGKTGTAQVAGLRQDETVAPKFDATPKLLRDHALFVAFAPADDPQIAVAVVAEHAGHGGTSAAPVARMVMDQYLLGKVVYAPNGVATPAAPDPESPADEDEPAEPPTETPPAEDTPMVPQQ